MAERFLSFILGLTLLLWVFLRHTKNRGYANRWHSFSIKHPIMSHLLSYGGGRSPGTITRELRKGNNSKLASFVMLVMSLVFFAFAL